MIERFKVSIINAEMKTGECKFIILILIKNGLPHLFTFIYC